MLASGVEPGLMAMPSGRFFGWVIGGTLPAALGADWLTSAWDQNAGMRYATPGVVAAEEAAARWLLDLLGLPDGAALGFTTGATAANFTGLAAGRQRVVGEAGWDLGPARSRRRTQGQRARRRRAPRQRSTWRCATWDWARPTHGRDGRAGCDGAGRARRRPGGPRRSDDRGAAGRQPALRRLRPVRGSASRRRTSGAPGCTWTAPSGSGPPLPRAAPPGGRRRRRRLVGHRRPQDAQRALRLRRLRGRGPPAAAGGHERVDQLPRPHLRGRRPLRQGARRCPGGRGACRSGRRCGRSAAPASRTWSTGSWRRPARSPTASPPCPARRC